MNREVKKIAKLMNQIPLLLLVKVAIVWYAVPPLRTGLATIMLIHQHIHQKPEANAGPHMIIMPRQRIYEQGMRLASIFTMTYGSLI